jgi:hypothetical protein
MKSALFIVALGAALALAGCKSNPYCLNCTDGPPIAPLDLSPSPDLTPASMPDLLMPDLAQPPADLFMPPDGCFATNQGVEICDHIDNDCNGTVDDVAPSKLIGDPNNCGACFNVCDFSAQHQFGACIGGAGTDGGATPMCVAAGCLPGFVTLAGGAACAYQCTPTTPPTEVCDGKDNNCDGKVDEGFTATWSDAAFQMPKYDSDPSNCGGCGTVCQLPGAVNKCGSDSKCHVDHCINNGTDTYRHNPATGLSSDVTGCEYHCAFASTTSTPGSDCDQMTCVFPPEMCNGIDDNCNFTVDDPPFTAGEMIGSPCYAPCPGGVAAGCKGECKPGMFVCAAGVRSCSGGQKPTVETCNKLDDDCNGKTDDPFTSGYDAGGKPLYDSDVNNCGMCGTVCGLQNAVNGCHGASAGATGTCYVVQCNSSATGGFAYVPTLGTCGGTSPAENGPGGLGCNYPCPVWPTGPEVCDGKDNNCNGVTDEAQSACAMDGLVTPNNFCSNLGVCAGQNIKPTCTGAGGWSCDYSGVAGVELSGGKLALTESHCDCLDNNCNGVVDKDGFATLGTSCQVGTGACGTAGFIGCDRKTGDASFDKSACMTVAGCSSSLAAAQPTKATDEQCNGKDDDCDGQIDERTPTGAPTCYNGAAHACKGYVEPMVKIGAAWIYEYEASRPDATGTSQGGNATRACSNAGVLPWADVTETEAAAACAAIKNSAGQPMRLCTAAEWQSACEHTASGTAWSFSSTQNSYLAQVCNDDNSGVGKAWATGTTGAGSATKLCYTDWTGALMSTATRVYDLSGNLLEWTSSTVSSGGNTYYQLKGGAFSAPPGGGTCEFSFDIFPASFANSDVGFRCCSDSAP